MIEVLSEDREILICIKPVNLLSQTDANQDNMVTRLEKQTGGRIYPVHRLDRETGGVMVFAKTKHAAAELSRQMAEHLFKKEYLVLTHGKPKEESGVFEDLLFKDSAKNKSYVVTRERKGVKKAYLAYHLLKTVQKNGEEYSLFSVKLLTGRTHQIRAQFSSRGMPLAGDRKYGAHDDCPQMGLWSYHLTFFHPKSGEIMSYTAAPQNIISQIF